MGSLHCRDQARLLLREPGTPNEVQVLSEVQGSSSNQLRRPSFRTVQFADSYLTYWNFDQANWVENSPYYVVSKTYRYQYETDGP